MAQFREAPTLVVLQTESPALKARFQDAVLFAEEDDHILLLSWSDRHKDHPDKLKRGHG